MKQIKGLMFIAAAAMAFVGCSKETNENPAPEVQLKTITINTDGQNSRTSIDEMGKVSWNPTGESLSVFEKVDAIAPQFKTTAPIYTLVNGKASFTIQYPSVTTGTSFLYGAISPNSAYITDSNNDPKAIKFNLLQSQWPSPTSYDSACDILIAKPQTTTTQAITLDFAFGRVIAMAKMSIKNVDLQANEFIKSVTFQADGKMVTGRGKVNLSDGVMMPKEWGYSSQYKFDNVVLNYADNIVATQNFDAWFTSAPFSIAANEKFTITIQSNKGKFVRQITIPEGKAINFEINKIASFGVDMATATFTPDIVDTSIFKVTFGKATATTTYVPTYDMGATGSSAANLTYKFTKTKEQIRGNSNKFNASDYADASSDAFWWAATDDLTISNIQTGSATQFALSFGAKTTTGTSTIKAEITKDGENFFPLSLSDVEAKLGKDAPMLKTLNFHFETAISDPISIRLTTGASTVVDDIKLETLGAEGENSLLVDFKLPPSLTVAPGDMEELIFAANSGTVGVAPVEQEILYEWGGGDCTFLVEKGVNDTWYTITDDNAGIITVTPTEYTSTTEARTGTVTISVSKAGTVILSSVVNIKQKMVSNGPVEATTTFDLTAAGTGIKSTKDGITIEFAKASGGTAPTYNSNSEEIRMYAKNTLTVSSSKTIKKIDFTFKNTTNDITANIGIWVRPTWTGEATSIIMTAGGTSGHSKIAQIVVTYID